MSVGWGIAATGRIARTVGQVIAAQPGMHVAAVGSREHSRAVVLAEQLGAPAAHGSYADLVADPTVEVVYVATPHAQHAGVVEGALRAGKAVLCEKPLTHTLAETQRLVALAESTGTFLMEAMWMRFNPLVQLLHRTVQDGRLGRLRSLHATMGFAAPADPQSRLWARDLGGGAVLDLGVYPVDLARLLLGEPQEVAVRGTVAATGVDSEASFQLGWASGARALLDTSLLTRLPGTAVLVGSAGHAELGPSFHAPTWLRLEVAGAPVELHELPDRSAGFVGEVREVVACLDRGSRQSATMPLAETVATMEILDRAVRQLHG